MAVGIALRSRCKGIPLILSCKMSPKVQGKTKTSPLWRFFVPLDETYAQCNLCKLKFSYKTSTSNLKKHLQNKHPTVNISVEDTRPQPSDKVRMHA